MHFLQFWSGNESLRDAALIGDHDHGKSRFVQKANARGHARKHMEVFPAGHVLTFGSFLIEDSITIQKHRSGQGTSPFVRRMA